MSSKKFAPKGGQCVNCVFAKRGCDHLKFKDMKVIATCKTSNVSTVRCVEFVRSK